MWLINTKFYGAQTTSEQKLLFWLQSCDGIFIAEDFSWFDTWISHSPHLLNCIEYHAITHDVSMEHNIAYCIIVVVLSKQSVKH